MLNLRAENSRARGRPGCWGRPLAVSDRSAHLRPAVAAAPVALRCCRALSMVHTGGQCCPPSAPPHNQHWGARPICHPADRLQRATVPNAGRGGAAAARRLLAPPNNMPSGAASMLMAPDRGGGQPRGGRAPLSLACWARYAASERPLPVASGRPGGSASPPSLPASGRSGGCGRQPGRRLPPVLALARGMPGLRPALSRPCQVCARLRAGRASAPLSRLLRHCPALVAGRRGPPSCRPARGGARETASPQGGLHVHAPPGMHTQPDFKRCGGLPPQRAARSCRAEARLSPARPGRACSTALRAAGYTGAGSARSANLGRCPSPRQGVGHPLHPPLQEGPSALRWAPLERSGGPQLAGASSLS